MVFNITTVDICGAAGINRPTVVVIFLSDAGTCCQAEIGRRAVLGAVTVKKYNAFIREIFCDCGTGRCRALDKQVGAGCVRDGLRFTLVLIGEAAVVTVVRCNQKYVGGFGIFEVFGFSAAL